MFKHEYNVKTKLKITYFLMYLTPSETNDVIVDTREECEEWLKTLT